MTQKKSDKESFRLMLQSQDLYQRLETIQSMKSKRFMVINMASNTPGISSLAEGQSNQISDQIICSSSDVSFVCSTIDDRQSSLK
jgi:hypothetical protein